MFFGNVLLLQARQRKREKDVTKVHSIPQYSEDIMGQDVLETGVYAFLPQVERAKGPMMSVSRAQAALAHSHGRGCNVISRPQISTRELREAVVEVDLSDESKAPGLASHLAVLLIRISRWVNIKLA